MQTCKVIFKIKYLKNKEITKCVQIYGDKLYEDTMCSHLKRKAMQP